MLKDEEISSWQNQELQIAKEMMDILEQKLI